MIISRTPFRISFFGGGTDYPLWYRKNSGSVLSTTINKYCYITCRFLPSFFEHKYRLVYSQTEEVKNIDEIKHPAARAVLNFMKFNKGVEIHYDGDLPARTGLGTSSAFTVGLINALYALRGLKLTKSNLTRYAIHVEQNILKENVGSQDQIAVSYGGFNRVHFLKNGKFDVKPISLGRKKMELFRHHLMLYFTGFSRIASKIAKQQIENIPKKKTELNSMQWMVDEAINILNGNDNRMLDLGKLLHESWQLKKNLSDKISNFEIDNIYDMALQAGAAGGKILGAGGGGFLLLFVEPERQPKVRKALKKLLEIYFEFENSGSQIIYAK